MGFKILFVIPVLEAGGGQRFISTLANYMSSRGHTITIVSLRKGESFYPLDANVNLVTLSYVPIQTENKVKRLVSRIETFFELRDTILKAQPDFIYSILSSTNLLTIASTLFSGIPLYVNDVMSPMRNRTKLERFARRILYPKAKGIICMTTEARDIISRETGAKNIGVIPRPLKEMIPPDSIKRTKTILNVGRLHPDKGQGDLIEAFAKLNDNEWELVFVGDGPSESELKKKCQQLGVSDKVEFVGAVANVDSWYYSSSIFAFTSYYEGWGNALSEAMHASLACVSYDCVAGPKELIDDQSSGFLIPVGDIDALSMTLDRLIENEDLRRLFGQNAHEASDRYHIENIAKRILNFCTQL